MNQKYLNTLKELEAYNADTIGFEDLSILLFITQKTISDLKNIKNDRSVDIKDLEIEPYNLLN